MRRTAGAALSVLLATECALAVGDVPPVRDGAYEVHVRIEIPNVQNWSWHAKEIICLPSIGNGDTAPFPVLTGNNPVAACPASDLRREGDMLTFTILCEGRNPSMARAAYQLGQDHFEGRIAMMMGAKNMTFTEVQSGRRIGTCDQADRR